MHQCGATTGRQRKREKKTDSAVENKERFSEGAFDFSGVSVNGGGVGNSPVRGHGLSRPERAGFLGGIVANCEDEVHHGSAGARELFPALAAQAGCRYASQLKLLSSFGTDHPRRMTPCAVVGGAPVSVLVYDAIGMERRRCVSREQEHNDVLGTHM